MFSTLLHHATDGVYNIDIHNQIIVSSTGVISNITLDTHSYTLVYLLGLAFIVMKFW